jgi:hypothetical protein
LEEILEMSKEAMLGQMKSNENKFAQVEDPEYTSDQIGMTCVKIQDMQAKRSAFRVSKIAVSLLFRAGYMHITSTLNA